MESEGPSVGWQERSSEAAAGAANHSNDIQIRLNGREHAIQAGTTVASLVAELGLPPDRVAVEVDRVIVRRADWEGTPLTPGGVVEVVHFVGGG
jgi:thiamine biosynthesis protein ThiS